MDVIIYLVFVCLIVYLVVSLLPVILPVVAILILILTILGWYTKHKIRKHMDIYEDTWSEQQDYSSQSSNLDSDDIIDVEFTERDDD